MAAGFLILLFCTGIVGALPGIIAGLPTNWGGGPVGFVGDDSGGGPVGCAGDDIMSMPTIDLEPTLAE